MCTPNIKARDYHIHPSFHRVMPGARVSFSFTWGLETLEVDPFQLATCMPLQV